MALPNLTPSSFDWPVQAAIGVVAIAVAIVLLLRLRERALLFALGACLLEIGLLIAARGLTRPFATHRSLYWIASFGIIVPPSIAGIVILTWRGWWKTAGFTPPWQWRRFRLLWLVALWLLLPSLSLLGEIHFRPTTVVLLTLYVVIATSMEEVVYRGIVLRATIRYGVIPAVAFSSLLFGVSHVNNLFVSASIVPSTVLEQAWLAGLDGVFLAAVRLRMNAIWPTIAAHALFDLFPLLVYGQYVMTRPPTIEGFLMATGIAGFFCLIGLFLVRKAKPSIIPTELKT